MTKKLFVLTEDCGNGSCRAHFTMNEKWIKSMQAACDNGTIRLPAIGVEGGSFNYTELTVPDDYTLEKLGVTEDCANAH